MSFTDAILVILTGTFFGGISLLVSRSTHAGIKARNGCFMGAFLAGCAAAYLEAKSEHEARQYAIAEIEANPKWRALQIHQPSLFDSLRDNASTHHGKTSSRAKAWEQVGTIFETKMRATSNEAAIQYLLTEATTIRALKERADGSCHGWLSFTESESAQVRASLPAAVRAAQIQAAESVFADASAGLPNGRTQDTDGELSTRGLLKLPSSTLAEVIKLSEAKATDPDGKARECDTMLRMYEQAAAGNSSEAGAFSRQIFGWERRSNL